MPNIGKDKGLLKLLYMAGRSVKLYNYFGKLTVAYKVKYTHLL